MTNASIVASRPAYVDRGGELVYQQPYEARNTRQDARKSWQGGRVARVPALRHRQARQQAQDTGRGGLIVQPKFPIGTDEDALERWFEEEAVRRGLIQGRRQVGPAPKDRGRILNDRAPSASGRARLGGGRRAQ